MWRIVWNTFRCNRSARLQQMSTGLREGQQNMPRPSLNFIHHYALYFPALAVIATEKLIRYWVIGKRKLFSVPLQLHAR
ncbi:MAG: hypothetical protein ACI9R3_003849, partial [Verrucomicrobiales bacterium]